MKKPKTSKATPQISQVLGDLLKERNRIVTTSDAWEFYHAMKPESYGSWGYSTVANVFRARMKRMVKEGKAIADYNKWFIL